MLGADGEDEIDLIFTVRAERGNDGTLLPVGVTVCWTDPRADARREIKPALEPLRRAKGEEVTAAPPDDLVVERAARQRAATERRAGLELDRAGRFADSRARMLRSRDLLAAAPMTAAVQDDLSESMMLASAPPTTAYGSHVRKSAQLREDQRRRGRQGSESKRQAVHQPVDPHIANHE